MRSVAVLHRTLLDAVKLSAQQTKGAVAFQAALSQSCLTGLPSNHGLLAQRVRYMASRPQSLFGDYLEGSGSSTSGSANAAYRGENLRVGPPAKPHPVSLRFALSRKPFFPIWTRNLRIHFRRKKKKRLGRGMQGRNGLLWRSQRGSFPKLKTWEGGTSPLHRRVPKWPEAKYRGKRKLLRPLSLAKLRYFIEKGRLDTRYPITMRHLRDCKACPSVKHGITIYNTNDFPFPYKINIEVMGADQSSIDMIKAVGGTVTIVYMNRISLRQHLKPHAYEILHKHARPGLGMVSYLEKYKRKGALVRYVKPLWLIEEERRLQTELRELRNEESEEGIALLKKLTQANDHKVY
mmetsp:Transcript_11437/g.25930  ORF Transcript_11437/g.25930 Transcript_11437/m.25930 type:complete len:349 (+) Transcript_11437:84-1130(+)